jgi:hypothetical protein
MQTTTYVRWSSIALIGLLVVLGFRAISAPVFVINTLSYPVDYYIGEGDGLFYVHQLLQGGGIYGDSTALPLYGNVYPPAYPCLMWAVGKVITPTLASLRVMALIPLVGVIAIVWLFLRRARVPWALVLAASLLVPCCYSIAQYLIYPRIDGWMAFFSLASLYFLTSQDLSGRQVILGALFAALALFTKQTAVFGICAVSAHLLITRRRKGVQVAAATVAICIAFLAISYLRFGPSLIQSMFSLTVRRDFQILRLHGVIAQTAFLGVLFAIATLRMVVHIRVRTWDLLDSYLVGHGAMVGLIAFDGGASNYFLPCYLGLVLAAALTVNDLLQMPSIGSHVPYAAGALTVLQLLLQIPYDNFQAPNSAELAEAYTAAEFLTSTQQPVYAERFWGAIADRSTTAQYFVEAPHIRMLSVDRGAAAMQALTEQFRERRFARVLLWEHGHHWVGFYNMVLKYYHVVREGNVRVFFGTAYSAKIIYLVPNATAEPAVTKSGTEVR